MGDVLTTWDESHVAAPSHAFLGPTHPIRRTRMMRIGKFRIDYDLYMSGQLELEDWVRSAQIEAGADFNDEGIIGPAEIASAIVIALMNTEIPGLRVDSADTKKMLP